MSRNKLEEDYPNLRAVAKALLDENWLATLASINRNKQVTSQLDDSSIPEPELEVEIETTRGRYSSPEVSANEHGSLERVKNLGALGPGIKATCSLTGSANDHGVNKEIEVQKLVEMENETLDANNNDGQLLHGKGKKFKANGAQVNTPKTHKHKLDAVSNALASLQMLTQNGIRPPRKIDVPLDGTQTVVLQCSICYLAFINNHFLLKHIEDKHQTLLKESGI